MADHIAHFITSVAHKVQGDMVVVHMALMLLAVRTFEIVALIYFNATLEDMNAFCQVC